MKKIISIFLCLVIVLSMAFVLTGCTKKAENGDENNTNQSSKTTLEDIGNEILNQSQEVTTKASNQFYLLSVQSHNSQFMSYTQLTKMTKTQVSDLVSKVKISNEDNKSLEGTYNNDFTVLVTFEGKTDKVASDSSISYDGSNAVIASKYSFYKATAEQDTNGIITKITIESAQ